VSTPAPPLFRALIRTRDRAAALSLLAHGLLPRRLDPDADTWALLCHHLASPAPSPAPSLALPALARLASRAELAVFAGHQIPNLAPLLAAPIQTQRRIDALLDLTTEGLAATLQAAGGPKLRASVCLLKGSASALHVYPEPACRQRRDLDLLVCPADFPAVRAALWNAGWRDSPVREARVKPFDGRTFGMRRTLSGLTLSVDLHRDLVTTDWCGLRGRGFRRAFLADSRRDLAPLPVTSATDTLLHTVAHIVHAGAQLPLKAWCDLLLLARQLLPEAPAVIDRVALFGLRTATWACLSVAARFFGADLSDLIAPLEPTPASARLLSALLRGDSPTPLGPGAPAQRVVHGLPELLRDP